MKRFFKKIIISILTWEARIVLRKYKPRIIAVTGNVGKTSAKDAIFAVLSGSHYVRKSEKSFNSEIGVPLTILGCQSGWNNPLKWARNIFEGLGLVFLKNHYPAWLVLEVGADRPRDIERIAKWLRPDIAVLTRIGEVPVHVEYFSSPDELAAEKAYLARAVRSGGIIIAHAGDSRVRAIAEAESVSGKKIMFFGNDSHAHIYISNEQITYDGAGKPEAINFKINYHSSSVPVTVRGTVGLHFAESAAAGAAVGIAEDINLVDIAARLSSGFEPQAGRMRVIEGTNGSTVLDDTYNASPMATETALGMLESLDVAGRKIAVLGDMMELGSYSADAHASVGARAARAADIFVAVGSRMNMAVEGAGGPNLKKESVKTCADAHEAAEYLKEKIKENDVVLVKGSQSMRMERVVEALMAHSEQKEELLVRQEKEWQT